MRDYNFNFATATDLQTVEVKSAYIRFYALTSGGGTDPRITVRSLGGGISAELLPGEGISLPRDERGWQIINSSGVAIAGKVKIAAADERFEVARFFGTVDVVDGEKARTLAGGMYGGAPSMTGANYNQVQLWNPAASGKNLIVTQLMVLTGGVSPADAFAKTAALATDVTATYGANKKLGGAMGVGLLKTESIVAAEAFALGRLWTCYGNNNGNTPWPIKGAVVVPPGYGLTVRAQVAGTTMGADFEWFEEPVA